MSKPGEHTTSIRLVEGPAKVPFLRVYVDGEFSRSYKVKSGIMVAGRDPDIDLPLEDIAISRKHFQLEFESGNRLYIQDLGSHNGTYVNGERVIRAPLAHTDQIDLGRIVIIISDPAHAPGTVIPFPSQKTDPGIELAKKKAAVVSQLPTEARMSGHEATAAEIRLAKKATRVAPAAPRPVPFRTLGTVAAVTSIAAVLAWGMYRWKMASVQTERVAIVPLEAAAPEIEAPLDVQPLNKELGRPTDQVTDVPSSGGEERAARKNRNVLKKGILDSLDRSLGDMPKDSLTGADQLVAAAPSGAGQVEKGLKKMRQIDPRKMVLQIEMPKTQPGEGSDVAMANAPKGATNVRNFDAKAYHAALRDRITGIEQCYAQHARSESDAGSVSVWFSISTAGDISKSGVAESSMKNKGLESCIVGRMTKVKADPPPWDGFTTTYTFKFGSRQKIKF